MIKKQMMVTVICFLLGCMLITACRKSDDENRQNTNETTDIPTPSPTGQTEETTEDNSETGEEDTSEETGEETDFISEKEAVKYIQDIIGERGYYFELLNDDINIDGSVYYDYQISDGGGPIKPDVLVNKENGELLCYKPDGSTAPFSEHPLYTETDSGEDSGTGEEGFTKEDALAQLGKVPSKDLGLPEELKEYSLIFDKWTINIKDVECYCINAYSDTGERKINMGLFYVATDGSVMYKFDSELDDFVEIKAVE